MSKYSGSGWHYQHIRHSNARKYGRAGGKYVLQEKNIAPFTNEIRIIYSKDRHSIRLYHSGSKKELIQVWKQIKGKGFFGEEKIYKYKTFKDMKKAKEYLNELKKHYGKSYPVLNRSTLQSIGARAGLDAVRQSHFIKFMQKRLPNERDESYAAEWAMRFKKGTEWDRADMVSKQVLYDIDPKRYVSDEQSIFKKGDYVAVMKAVTTDPYNRRGQIGTVTTIDADDVVSIIFSDGQYGMYDEDTLILLKR